jgi:hypothetical protein
MRLTSLLAALAAAGALTVSSVVPGAEAALQEVLATLKVPAG